MNGCERGIRSESGTRMAIRDRMKGERQSRAGEEKENVAFVQSNP